MTARPRHDHTHCRHVEGPPMTLADRIKAVELWIAAARDAAFGKEPEKWSDRDQRLRKWQTFAGRNHSAETDPSWQRTVTRVIGLYDDAKGGSLDNGAADAIWAELGGRPKLYGASGD